MADYPDTFQLPIDVAVNRSEERVEIPVEDMRPGERVFDIGSKTIDHYSRIIRSSGTIFMSGPPGLFEDQRFGLGTESLLRAMASSFGTTIVSGGHLSAALQRFGIKEWIDLVSTAGGALVLFLGAKFPLIEAPRFIRKEGQVRKLINVAVNGYNVIGRRVADAVSVQTDMKLVGVAKVKPDYKARSAIQKGYRVFARRREGLESFPRRRISRGTFKRLGI